jgi:hypothetical protein
MNLIPFASKRQVDVLDPTVRRAFREQPATRQ